MHAETESRDHAPQAPETEIETATEPPRTPAADPSKRHPPLRFVFSGYSLWLDLAQANVDGDGRGDLDRALIDAADRFDLGGAIPSPHVTVLYGIDTIEEDEEARRMFREDVKRVLLEEAEKRRRTRNRDGDDDDDDVKLWPDVSATGILVDVEIDGVGLGTMVRSRCV